MKDIIYEFLDYISLEKKYSDNTEINYEIDLFKYEEFLNKNKLDYKNVKYKDITMFIMELSKAKYKSTSINRLLSSLRSFYNFLEKRKIVKDNPFEIVNNLKSEKRLPNYFKYEEFKMMINILENNPLDIRNKLILMVLITTGIRVGELSSIKCNDINLSDREIKVLGKGNKTRIVYFNHQTLDAFNDYLNNSRNILLNGKQSEFLLINHNGGKLTTRGIRLIIENIVKKACVNNKITPHTFRHTFATMMLSEGCDIKSVQELLGHSDISTTGIYTHLTNEEVRRAYMHAHPRSKV